MRTVPLCSSFWSNHGVGMEYGVGMETGAQLLITTSFLRMLLIFELSTDPDSFRVGPNYQLHIPLALEYFLWSQRLTMACFVLFDASVPRWTGQVIGQNNTWGSARLIARILPSIVPGSRIHKPGTTTTRSDLGLWHRSRPSCYAQSHNRGVVLNSEPAAENDVVGC